jgi:AraC-like DNA-binding protein
MIPSSSVVRSNTDLQFASEDLGETEEFLISNYAKTSIGGVGKPTATRINRRWLGEVSFDELSFSFDMSYDAEPLGRVCLCRVHSGRIEENFIGEPPDVFAPGDVTLYTPPELPFSGRACRSTYDLTMFDPTLLNRVASPAPGTGDSVRLLGHRPVSVEATRQLHAAIDYVRVSVRADELRDSPLVASTAANHLAAVVVSTFPTNADTAATADASASRPALLRRATAFIEANAHTDVALADIAAAVHVTPRALQYVFRRHLDMSPVEYLRRVRLDHAHRQLQCAEADTTSVQKVAAQWGFAHPGRFSALYRQTYGRNPSDTLRG